MLGNFRRGLSVVLIAGLGMAAQLTFASTVHAVDVPGKASPAVVTQWNVIANRTVFTENLNPIPSSSVYFSFMSIAMFDAVVAIDGGYRPYAYRGPAPRHASAEVAAATAAHRVLSTYFPASVANLDADYAAYLSTVPSGRSTSDGQLVGEASAAAIIALRTADGRNGTQVLTVPARPGVWRPTPPGFLPMLVPWLAFTKPLVLRSQQQFPLRGPAALTSKAYTRDFLESKSLGAKDGSSRTVAQTETALFWNANSVLQYRVALGDRLTRHPVGLVAAARAFALLDTGTADGNISCWRSKYDFAFWRPITAINLADTDGNPATVADPTWQPLVTTPPYPEYASGHACITGSATNTFSYLFGPRHLDLNVYSSVTATTRHYSNSVALDDETKNARIWLGLHFRTGMNAGNKIGHEASHWVITHAFRAVCDRDGR